MDKDCKRRKIVPKYLRRVQASRGSNVVALRSVDEFGVVRTKNRLKVWFGTNPDEKQAQLDISEWLDAGDLGVAVANFIAVSGRSTTHTTSKACANSLSCFRGFLRTLEQESGSPIVCIGDLPRDLMERFENWLNSYNSRKGKDCKPFKKSTKAIRYNTVKRMIKYWQETDRYRKLLPENMAIRRNPWPGAHYQIEATAVLDPVSLLQVREAALGEITSDLEKRQSTFAVLADDQIILPNPHGSSVTPFKDLRVKLKVIAECFNGRPPPTQPNLAPGLSRSLRAPYGSTREITDRLHFSLRSLVPYLILLALDTSFNAEGLLTLCWSDIQEHPVYGAQRWQVSARKNRANGIKGGQGTVYHRRSFAVHLSAIDSTVNLLKAVKRFSTLTRSLVAEQHQDRVFLYYVEAQNSCRSFDVGSGTSSVDGSWGKVLNDFIEEHKLPKFTFRTLRATAGDVVHQTFGDIKAQQVAMGHASVGMTLRHYRAGAAKQRDAEALSQGMAWRERYIATGGKADTRNGSLLSGANNAATPGFGCVDPYNAPFELHTPGRLCTSFGSCPTCPLATVNPDDPQAYARLMQYRERLIDARLTLDPIRYLTVWAPQLAYVQDYWLPRFSEQGKAGETLTLPPFPELE